MKKDVTPQDMPRESVALAHALGRVINNCIHGFWLSAADARDDLVFGHDSLGRCLESNNEMTVLIVSPELLINDLRLKEKTHQTDVLVSHLASLDVSNISFEKGVTLDEFGDLIEILGMRPGEIQEKGGFAAMLEAHHLSKISTKKLAFREVLDGYVVISKQQLQGALDSAEAKGGGENTQEILAFLRGDVVMEDDNVKDSLHDLASHPEKLAALILHAAEIQKQAVGLQDGETLEDLVVGCLRRAYDGLMKDKTITRSIKGRRDLSRSLILLEKEILQRLHEHCDKADTAVPLPEPDSASGEDKSRSAFRTAIASVTSTPGPSGTHDGVGNTVSEAILNMTQELHVDSLVSDYMKKQRASTASEQHLMDFIGATKSGSTNERALRDRLEHEGMNRQGWQELLVKTRAALGQGSEAGSERVVDAITRLSVLLAGMDKFFAENKGLSGDEQSEYVTNMLTQVSLDIQKLATTTKEKIRGLVENIQADAALIEKAQVKSQKAVQAPRVRRNQVLETISEIVEEMGEPLELIREACGMIHSEKLGEIPPPQIQVVEMMSESANTLKELMYLLKGIAAGKVS